MNHYTQFHRPARLAALLLCLALCLTFVSCDLIEVREASVEGEEETEVLVRSLTPPAGWEPEKEDTAEPAATLTSFPEIEAETEETPASVTFALTGDLCLDTNMIADAVQRAGEGQSFRFLTMFTGVYQILNSADFALGAFSAVRKPIGDDGTVGKTPEEALAALAEIGYDALDTFSQSGAGLNSWDITAFNDNGKTTVLEKDGLRVALCAVGGEDTPVGSPAALRSIGDARESADLALVFVRWDEDSTHEDRCAAAYYMAEAGADADIGLGPTLGAVDTMTTADGRTCVVAYSLGNFLVTPTDADGVCGGILRFTFTQTDDGAAIGDVSLTPTVTHVSRALRDYQIFLLSGYGNELAAGHAVEGLTLDALYTQVFETVPASVLPKDFAG